MLTVGKCFIEDILKQAGCLRMTSFSKIEKRGYDDGKGIR